MCKFRQDLLHYNLIDRVEEGVPSIIQALNQSMDSASATWAGSVFSADRSDYSRVVSFIKQGSVSIANVKTNTTPLGEPSHHSANTLQVASVVPKAWTWFTLNTLTNERTVTYLLTAWQPKLNHWKKSLNTMVTEGKRGQNGNRSDAIMGARLT